MASLGGLLLKKEYATVPVISLVCINLLPLAGVLFFGWDVTNLVLLYWAENLVVGFYNILKMLMAQKGKLSGPVGKIFQCLFFTFHYGAFCGAHGFFLLTFFKLGNLGSLGNISENWPGPLVFIGLLVAVLVELKQQFGTEMLFPIIGLFISHGVSFYENYLQKQEYLRFSVKELMNQPYRRIVALHLAIIFGGFGVMALGSPLPLLVILVLLKIKFDVYLHFKEHPLPAETAA